MTRKEYEAMCAEKPEMLLEALHRARKEHGPKSEQYLAAFQALWESRIPHLADWEIGNIMETAKPHTNSTGGLETMGWLYDRLMLVSVERGI
jgi:mannose/cellobiose epimerase-like protein (N-acyl-D-glucosamine 2-epimerase family)